MSRASSIEKFMTHSPHTINPGVPLSTAKSLMKKHGLRHLPVQTSGHVVGVLTERDLLLATSLDPSNELYVDDAMTPDPYCVSTDASLGDVAEQMATNRYGCAVVCDGTGRAIGVFTVTDALRALADKLNEKARKAAIAKGA